MEIQKIIISGLIGFLIGSTSFTCITARIFGYKLSEVGSKNLGSTNLSRVVGWKIAVLPAILDALKTIITLLIIKYWFKGTDVMILVGSMMSVFGHIFPFWNKFKGGKGVASLIGFGFNTQSWTQMFILLFIMVVITIKTKMMIYASLIVSIVILIGSFIWKSPWFMTYTVAIWPYTLVLVITVLLKHRDNISRLINGTEYKAGIKK